MGLTCIYVVGVLEYIAQQEGKIAIRIHCNYKVHVYGNREINHTFKTKLCGEFSLQELTLSPSIAAFVEGDTVKLTRYFDEDSEVDRFTLENVTLSLAKDRNFDVLKPESPAKDLLCTGVNAILEHIAQDKENVYLRLKCWEKTEVFLGKHQDRHERTEYFNQILYGEIPRADLHPGAGIETLSVYKKGDSVNLSHSVGEKGFVLDNLTLCVLNPYAGYKSSRDLYL